jgi:hypothetical protein
MRRVVTHNESYSFWAQIPNVLMTTAAVISIAAVVLPAGCLRRWWDRRR